MVKLFLSVCGLLVFETSSARALQNPIYEKDLPPDHPAIGYFQKSLDDPIARLNPQLKAKKVSLEYSADGSGYLGSLLFRLDVNSDSQVLVFSKTSFQSNKISPRNPRAIYFNDAVAVAAVDGGDIIEVASLDPTLGIAFYTLDSRKSEQPVLIRRDVCLRCHQGPATMGVPGIFVSSVSPSASGTPSRSGRIVTDHRTGFEQRWGGWYITGSHGKQRHRGNAVAIDASAPQELDTEQTFNLTNLFRKFVPPRYLQPVSDIVALMTLEHQTQMTNLIIRAGWVARVAEHDHKAGQAVSAQLGSTIDQIISYMLFADETPLLEPVRGVSTFTRTFSERGRRDRMGRSLRDFDLQKRLFQYPLSYMIYSAAFDALPVMVLDRIYQRLYDVLTGSDQSKMFANLSLSDRSAILEILQETKPNLPAYFKGVSNGEK